MIQSPKALGLALFLAGLGMIDAGFDLGRIMAILGGAAIVTVGVLILIDPVKPR